MQILSRNDLLQMKPEELLATAECHGMVLTDLPQGQWLDAFDEYLDFWRGLAEAA